jgi:hypothetical protein
VAGDDEMAAARARAAVDQQMALVEDSVTRELARARRALPLGSRADVWTLMVGSLAATLECRSKPQHYAVEMLVTALLRLADAPDAAGPGEKEVPEKP